MEMVAQLSLFSQHDDFKEFDILWRKQKKKRVHYKTPTYRKAYKNDINDDGFIKDDIKTWGRMNKVYQELAGFFPMTELKDGTYIKENEFMRYWCEKYDREIYQFEGNTYKGQDFRVITAEIIGSEFMRIDKRLQLHENVLKLLKNNADKKFIKKYIDEVLSNEQDYDKKQ